MPESLAPEALIRFDYPTPDADVPWQIDDLGRGVFARYRRTIAQKSRVITGTGGYREGVDFRTEIHCATCCCTPSRFKGCHHPAGGFVVIGGRSGCASVWQIAIATLAALHLQDPIRHVKPTRCTPDECRILAGINPELTRCVRLMRRHSSRFRGEVMPSRAIGVTLRNFAAVADQKPA